MPALILTPSPNSSSPLITDRVERLIAACADRGHQTVVLSPKQRFRWNAGPFSLFPAWSLYREAAGHANVQLVVTTGSDAVCRLAGRLGRWLSRWNVVTWDAPRVRPRRNGAESKLVPSGQRIESGRSSIQPSPHLDAGPAAISASANREISPVPTGVPDFRRLWNAENATVCGCPDVQPDSPFGQAIINASQRNSHRNGPAIEFWISSSRRTAELWENLLPNRKLQGIRLVGIPPRVLQSQLVSCCNAWLITPDAERTLFNPGSCEFQALRQGVPLLVSNQSCCLDRILDGNAGFPLCEGDGESLLDALLELHESPSAFRGGPLMLQEDFQEATIETVVETLERLSAPLPIPMVPDSTQHQTQHREAA